MNMLETALFQLASSGDPRSKGFRCSSNAANA